MLLPSSVDGGTRAQGNNGVKHSEAAYEWAEISSDTAVNVQSRDNVAVHMGREQKVRAIFRKQTSTNQVGIFCKLGCTGTQGRCARNLSCRIYSGQASWFRCRRPCPQAIPLCSLHLVPEHGLFRFLNPLVCPMAPGHHLQHFHVYCLQYRPQ